VLIKCGASNHRFGLETTRVLLDRMEFTAISCMSHMLAMGATAALHERGLNVPGDSAIVGVDNIYIAPLLPWPLSTIDWRISEPGSPAIGTLTEFLTDPARPRRTVVMEPPMLAGATN